MKKQLNFIQYTFWNNTTGIVAHASQIWDDVNNRTLIESIKNAGGKITDDKDNATLGRNNVINYGQRNLTTGVNNTFVANNSVISGSQNTVTATDNTKYISNNIIYGMKNTIKDTMNSVVGGYKNIIGDTSLCYASGVFGGNHNINSSYSLVAGIGNKVVGDYNIVLGVGLDTTGGSGVSFITGLNNKFIYGKYIEVSGCFNTINGYYGLQGHGINNYISGNFGFTNGNCNRSYQEADFVTGQFNFGYKGDFIAGKPIHNTKLNTLKCSINFEAGAKTGTLAVLSGLKEDVPIEKQIKHICKSFNWSSGNVEVKSIKLKENNVYNVELNSTFVDPYDDYKEKEAKGEQNEVSNNISYNTHNVIFGGGNIALGFGTFISGYNNVQFENSYCSFITGHCNRVNNPYETAFGKWNKSSSDTLFSIGNGESHSNRKNAFEIKTNGDVLFGNTNVSETIKTLLQEIESLKQRIAALEH